MRTRDNERQGTARLTGLSAGLARFARIEHES